MNKRDVYHFEGFLPGINKKILWPGNKIELRPSGLVQHLGTQQKPKPPRKMLMATQGKKLFPISLTGDTKS